MNETTWVTISRAAIVANLRLFIARVAPAAVMPIIKSNAYGHGLLEVAQVIKREKIWGVGVANAPEALALRQNGFRKPILVLNWAADDLDQLIRQGIHLTVYDRNFAVRLNRRAKRLNRTVYIHLKFDSGTTRLGLYEKEFLALAKQCQALRNLRLAGIYSHFAESENATTAFTRVQLQRFEMVIAKIRSLGIAPATHIACTAAAINFPASRFDVARIGIGLYGLWPSVHTQKTAQRSLPLRPVLSWYTRIIQLKTVPPQTPVGYGRSYTTKKRSRIAVIPVGYWDGFDRGLSNRGVVAVHGVRCPIRGRVCMNLSMIDVSAVPRAKTGDVVTLIGRDGRGVVTADEMARDSATINYETVTRINPLIPRKVVA